MCSLLAYFNCRDLGTTGSFLRSDYSVSCGSVEYNRFFYVALLGVAVVPIGIPLLFCMVIHHRFHPLLRNPSLLLHDNFAVEWRYYEVYDLIRKLLLTSLVVYVAPPDTSSQCLYLLLVDTTALILLAYSRPYANGNDDFLSSSLVTVECISFLLALIILSGIATEENYRTSSLYGTLFILALFALACFVPLTLALKFRAVRTRAQACVDKIFAASRGYGLTLPNLSRVVDSRRRLQDEVEDMRNTLHDIRLSMMDPVDLHDLYGLGSMSDEGSSIDGDGDDMYPPLSVLPRMQRTGVERTGVDCRIECNPLQPSHIHAPMAEGRVETVTNPVLASPQEDRDDRPRNSDWIHPEEAAAGSVALTALKKGTTTSPTSRSNDSMGEGYKDDGQFPSFPVQAHNERPNPPPIPPSPPTSTAAPRSRSAESHSQSPAIPSFPPPPIPSARPSHDSSKFCQQKKHETVDCDSNSEELPDTFQL